MPRGAALRSPYLRRSRPRPSPGTPGGARPVTGQPTRLCLSWRYTLLEGVGVSGPGGFDTVLVVDFGAQYAQLIARRVRECHVYSEIVPHTMPVEQLLARKPKAIILSGGPASVYETGAPPEPPAGSGGRRLFEVGVPVLGICYGFQLMAAGLGGTVAKTGTAEYGGTTLDVRTEGDLFAGLPASQQVWMS